jgi:tripartite-type tricarboxylate transporter receptor subunit TctC
VKRLANLVLMIVFVSLFFTVNHLWGYPDKPIEVIVNYAAGGGNDVTARIFAEQCKKYLPQPLIIVNKVGGGGALGLTAGAKAKPDGYTLNLAPNAIVTDQFYRKGVEYNYKSFTPIIQVATDPAILVVQAGGPYDTSLEKFLEHARKNPEKVRLGAGGIWSVQDDVRNLLEREAKVKFTKVPFGGGAPAVTALLGGHLEATIAYLTEFKGHFDAGKLKPIAVSGNKRSPFLPNVPTFSECDVPIPVEVRRLIVAPAGTPESILQILETAFQKTLDDPDTQKAFNAVGINLQGKDRVSAQKAVEEEFRFYSKMVKDLGIEPK